MEPIRNLDDAIVAARELSRVACHLADVAARATRSSALPENSNAGARAMDASLRAARAAFLLDDAARARVRGDDAIWLAIDTIAVAEDAIGLAREALESMAPAPQDEQRASSPIA